MSDDDDVEEGQIMQEEGDDVELIEGLEPNGMSDDTAGKLRVMFEQLCELSIGSALIIFMESGEVDWFGMEIKSDGERK